MFYPLDLAKGDSLNLTQIKLVNDATTFIGTRNMINACKDFVNVGFLSVDFPGPFPGILWPQEKVSKRSLEVDYKRFNEYN